MKILISKGGRHFHRIGCMATKGVSYPPEIFGKFANDYFEIDFKDLKKYKTKSGFPFEPCLLCEADKLLKRTSRR